MPMPRSLLCGAFPGPSLSFLAGVLADSQPSSQREWSSRLPMRVEALQREASGALVSRC